jgi:two-component system chemotaxis response regulator CheB
MDYHMPEMNGLDATRRIMQVHPVPIVIVSASTSRTQVASAHALLDAGALAVLETPPGPADPRHRPAAAELVETVKWVSEVKLVKRWAKRTAFAAPALSRPLPGFSGPSGELKLVAIGASTGGPLALRTILSGLASDFPVPVVIVQHMAEGFTQGLVDWLAQSSGFAVRIAREGEALRPATAYVAPERFHMGVTHDARVVLDDGAAEGGHRPSVAHLFRSVARAFSSQAIGVLLTGMGRDGAQELKLMKDTGAVTIAQDEETSIVHGMPGEAIQLGAAIEVLAADRIAASLIVQARPQTLGGRENRE